MLACLFRMGASDVAVALLSSSFRRTPPGELPELMDRPECDLAALRDALETIDRAGRLSGRDRILRRGVRRLLHGRRPAELSLLDIGAGAGHGTLRLARRLGARGWRPRLVLADLHPGALRLAREPHRASWPTAGPGLLGGTPARPDPGAFRIDLVRLTGPFLPFQDGSFDLALSTNTLHHLSRGEAAGMLSEMARVARWGLVVVDLRRSRLAYAATRLLAETLWRGHPFPRHDGPRSVRRAFTAPEARELLGMAGLEGGEVKAHALWIGIRWGRSGAAPAETRLRRRPVWAEPGAAIGPAEACP